MFENESVDFDFDEVDKNLKNVGGNHDLDKRQYAIQAVNRLFDYIFNKPSMQENYLNFVALVYIMRPDLIDGKTVRQISNELGIPKSPLGRLILKMREKIGYEGILARPSTRTERNSVDTEQPDSFQYELKLD